MAKDFDTLEDSNRSSNPSIHDVSDPARRTLLRGGLGASLGALLAPLAGCQALPPAPGGTGGPALGFSAVAASAADAVIVPPGYTATPLAPWGEPVGIAGAMPAFRFDAGNSADEQAVQMGMHHDGLEYYALDGSRRGLLAVNQEYTDESLLHGDGQAAFSLEKVRKSQAAHGITVIEVERRDQQFEVVRPSRYARRITANTPFAIGGPAAGHQLMKTAADPAGRTVLGTIGNCASGKTPWGTYLSGEENWANYFTAADTPTAHERRWGINRATYYRWPEFDERFDTVRHPNEPNRFGWVVEVDPADPTSTPVKRTAIGRGAHEGAWVAVTKDQRAVVYSGEDARFEYIYKFVSRDRIQPAGNGKTAAQANATLLDHGTLYVARFDGDGSGRWLPLVHGAAAGRGPLTTEAGFADQGEVVIKARQAADLLGATKMDRPEWLAIDPASGWVYCTLTNNPARGTAGQPGVDAANPRARNTMGHIIRWQEQGDFSGETFQWNHLLLAGDPANPRAAAKGNVRGDAFAGPDTIAFDKRGVLWIGTDHDGSNQGEFARMGNNQLLACNPVSGEVRRFLVGPKHCEITGLTWTPDGRTMFLNVQHPGSGSPRDGSTPRQHSNWPDFNPAGRPRSSTVVVRRHDGGVIGA
ncbi:MAG: Tat pathway signal protein [Leptothrix sp. (in: Bacteria)]|nr:Tat pathway signal protein [Leptothrix sp. (in: b-proteobacteria)]